MFEKLNKKNTSEPCLVFLNKGKHILPKLSEQICKISCLYPEFMNDYQLTAQLGTLARAYNTEKIKFVELRNLFIQKPRDMSGETIKRIERILSEIINSFSPFLISIEKACGKENFTKITNYMYDNQKNYRILYEMRNILQHKNLLNVHLFQDVLVINIKNLLKNYKITQKKFESTFFQLEYIEVLTITKAFEQMEEMLTMFVFFYLRDVNAIKRFLIFIKQYEHDERYDSICIREIKGINYDFHYILPRQIELVHTLCSTIPQTLENIFKKILD